jgi:hypothetical protein
MHKIKPARGKKYEIFISFFSLKAERFIDAKINKKLELEKEDIIVKSPIFTNIIVIILIRRRLTHGIFFVLSLIENSFGSAFCSDITLPSLAVPNNVALIADEVESKAPSDMSKNPAFPKKGFAAIAKASSLYFTISFGVRFPTATKDTKMYIKIVIMIEYIIPRGIFLLGFLVSFIAFGISSNPS